MMRAQESGEEVAQSRNLNAMNVCRSRPFVKSRDRARLARVDAHVTISATVRELACLIRMFVTSRINCVAYRI